MEVGVDSGDEALAGCLFVAGCAVDLTCEIEVAQVFGLEGVMQLSRRKEVVFDGIAWSEHPGMFESRDLTHGLELGFFGQGRGESVEVGFDSMTPFGLDEDLVTLFVREPMDLVFNAWTVARPFAGDGARIQWAVLQAAL